MKFKEVELADGIANNLIIFKDETDFNELAEKKENRGYLFKSVLMLTDSDGKEVKAKEIKIVFDKESKTYFGHEKQLISDEKMAELEALNEEEDGAEEPEFVDEELKKAGITDGELTEAMKGYIEENKATSDAFVNDNKFQRYLLRKVKKVRKFWESKGFEIRDYLSELAEQKPITELFAKFSLEEAKNKDALYNEIAGEIVDLEDYATAKSEATKKALIEELLYKKSIPEFNSNDVMRIKGKAEILLAKKKKS